MSAPFKFQECNLNQVKGSYVRVQPGNYVLPSTIREYADDIYNMDLQQGDVLLLSWPKTGTHWCSELVWNVCNDVDLDKAKKLPLLERWKFIDVPSDSKQHVCALELTDKPMGRIDKLLDGPSPRYLISHLPLSLFPPNTLDLCKVIYVTRNPMDTCVSLYRFLELRPEANKDLETFIEDFMEGNVVFSPFWSHVGEAWKLKDHPNLFFLTYEDMKKDLPGTILRVGQFFNKSLTSDQVARLSDHLSFGKMQKNPAVNAQYLKKDGKIRKDGEFIRKGIVGDWKNHMTPEMETKMKSWCDAQRGDCSVTFEGVDL